MMLRWPQLLALVLLLAIAERRAFTQVRRTLSSFASFQRLRHYARATATATATTTVTPSCTRLFDTSAGRGGEEDLTTVEDDINSIIETYLRAESTAEGIRTVNPSLLIDNAHFLAKGRLYEKVMKRRVEETKAGEVVQRLESVDRFLHGFVKAERKSRSRLKVNYLIAGASSGRLEESVELLYEAEEIDEDLLLYLNGLISRQLLRSGGPTAESEDDLAEGGSGQQSISVLRMLYKRLEAQMKTQGKKELVLLAKLLAEGDPDAREVLLKTRLAKVEDMEEFEQFLSSGVELLSASASTSTSTSVGQLERMKDILLSLRQLLKFYGSNQDEIFATGRDRQEEV